MKSVIAALVVLGSLNAGAAANRLYTCKGVSDPDFANVYIYKIDGKFVATINVLYGDGDNFATDTIELDRLQDGNDSVQTFVQVEGSYPAPPEPETEPGEEYKPTYQTRHVQLSVPYLAGDGHMITPRGPHKEEIEEEFNCKPAKR